MIDDAILKSFSEQFGNLRKVVVESSARSIKEPEDRLFSENQNIFVKLYLVGACSMLEAFIQDLAAAYVQKLQDRINSANFPFNLIMWIAEHDKAKLEFKPFEAKKSAKDISDLISPNYWKTLQAFSRVGIDLSTSDIKRYKDFVTTTVEKRNKIVHYNDDALDLSFRTSSTRSISSRNTLNACSRQSVQTLILGSSSYRHAGHSARC